MERAWVGFAATVVAIGLMVVGVVLVTWDVHSRGARAGEVGPSACGSAWDVVLRRGHGDMGGEPVPNQPFLDRQCVRASGRLVVAGTALGTAGGVLGLGLLGVWLVRARGGALPGERALAQPEDADR